MGVAEHLHVLLDYLNHRQIQCQWGIYAGVALAIDIEMKTVIAQIILNHEASDKVPFNILMIVVDGRLATRMKKAKERISRHRHRRNCLIS